MGQHPTAKVPIRPRYPWVDAVRGTAIALMIAYHFCFDLVYFGVLSIDFNHTLFWLGLRSLIVSLFLGVMGMSLMLASRHGLRWRPYLRRLALLLASAGLVSLGSYLLFPASMIFFGVLHFIVVASVLALPFVHFYWINLVAGASLIIFGLIYQNELFNQPWLQWFGLMTYKPVTEDYVPLLPWFGVVLIGIFAGKAIYHRAPLPRFAAWQPVGTHGKILAWAGRHSLAIYLIHQPVLLSVMYPLLLIRNYT
ncbi:MAG: DUF1624 domain-containing protein [Gammaproteobacteria bacterium]|nr:DUF1624 domain-containing protein [Gammaproteobacteria bacterium]